MYNPGLPHPTLLSYPRIVTCAILSPHANLSPNMPFSSLICFSLLFLHLLAQTTTLVHQTQCSRMPTLRPPPICPLPRPLTSSPSTGFPGCNQCYDGDGVGQRGCVRGWRRPLCVRYASVPECVVVVLTSDDVLLTTCDLLHTMHDPRLTTHDLPPTTYYVILATTC